MAMSGETATFLAGGEIPVTPAAERRQCLNGTSSRSPTSRSASASTFSSADHYRRSHQSQSCAGSESGDDRRSGQRCRQHDRIDHHPGHPDPTGLDHRRAGQRPELCHRGPAAAQLRSRTSQKVPWLGDVPVLGTLFKSDAYQRQETELVIIVTPYFVEPVSGHRAAHAALPATGCRRPTPIGCSMQRFNHPTPPQRLSGRARAVGCRALRRLQARVGAVAMRSLILVLLALDGTDGACDACGNDPVAEQAAIRYARRIPNRADTASWRSPSSRAAGRLDAGQEQQLRAPWSSRTGRACPARDEFVVVTDGSGSGALQQTARAHVAGTTLSQCRRPLGWQLGRTGDGDGAQPGRRRAFGIPYRDDQLPELQPGQHRQPERIAHGRSGLRRCLQHGPDAGAPARRRRRPRSGSGRRHGRRRCRPALPRRPRAAAFCGRPAQRRWWAVGPAPVAKPAGHDQQSRRSEGAP